MVDAGYAREGRYQVDVAGVRVGVAVGLRAPFDPGGDRVRGEYAAR